MEIRTRTSHLKIVDHIRGRIVTGALKRGDRLPSFEQLHRQFGVAPHTVSKALGVLELDGTVSRRRGSGVYVEQNAPRTKQLRIAVTGMPGHRHASDYWGRFLAGIQGMASGIGATVTLLPERGDVHWPDYSGVLWYNPRPAEIEDVQSAGVPIVAVGAQAEGLKSVTIDDYSSGFQATRHLISLGNIRIGFLGWLPTQVVCSRLSGYFTAMSAVAAANEAHSKDYFDSFKFASPAFDSRLVRGLGFPAVYKSDADAQYTVDATMQQWFADGFEALGCTALVVQSDEFAAAVIRFLSNAGYRVPDDISVIGFDNDSASATSSPTLSSVAGDMVEFGAASVRVLKQLVEVGAESTESVTIPVRLFARDSTAAPRQ